ncbi:N-acetylmuramoyl-L-alanine amidase, partial [Zhongshania sp.]|uniref:N-acetylmuramoyl-L-alanine amidase n=1 Tax=Zhongshania sp. TaxID=1971902 RepID=UPI00356744CA
LIVGHTATAMGAQTLDGKMSEYNYNFLAAQRVGLPYARRDFGGRKGAAKKMGQMGVDVSVELHCNAYNGKAHGAEILVLAGDYKSRAYAEDMLESYCTRFKKRSRGVKEIGRGGRGYYNLKYVKDAGVQVVLLIEPFFIDNEDDYISYLDYADWLKDYCGGIK